jgi:hypothetical protein
MMIGSNPLREQVLALLRIEQDQRIEELTSERENKTGPIAIPFQRANVQERRTSGTGCIAEIRRITY